MSTASINHVRVFEATKSLESTRNCFDSLHESIVSVECLAPLNCGPKLHCIGEGFEQGGPHAGVDLVAPSRFRCREYRRLNRRLPKTIRVDNGTEFTSKALEQWAYANNVILGFSRLAKPTDNAFIESFNGRVRAECLNESWFLSLDDARRLKPGGTTTAIIDRTDRRVVQPVDNLAPREFAESSQVIPDR